MPVQRRVAAFLDSVAEFAIALFKHWFGFMSGGVVTVGLLAIYERFVSPIPNFYYLGILFVGFLVAAYLAWANVVNQLPNEPEINLFLEVDCYSPLPQKTIGVDGVYDFSGGDAGGIMWAKLQFSKLPEHQDREKQWPTNAGTPIDALRCAARLLTTVTFRLRM